LHTLVDVLGGEDGVSEVALAGTLARYQAVPVGVPGRAGAGGRVPDYGDRSAALDRLTSRQGVSALF
jgi:hypothetical protein